MALVITLANMLTPLPSAWQLHDGELRWHHSPFSARRGVRSFLPEIGRDSSAVVFARPAEVVESAGSSPPSAERVRRTCLPGAGLGGGRAVAAVRRG